MDRLGVKGMPQVAHFVQYASQSPHITFVTIGLCFEKFWRHIVGRANACVCEVLRVIKDSSDTEITKSYLKIKKQKVVSKIYETYLSVFQENILSLHITM